ncbi:MAG: tRNA nucleotidyltransferase [Desulfovibrionaceae bacterium]|nr:tRNA nucleotidyltransferase [Desulfovibrionaceae bacterium]MBF0515137.1 tRNA nucleotidyltransferase [Desulfovibrionaceae bacterium]
MKLYVVGGAVRDRLLGRAEADRDYLVLDATPEEFLRRFPAAKPAGKSFPVYLLGGREYAWPRGATLEADLAARDLTINALAMPVGPDPDCADLADPACLGDLSRIAAHPQSFADLAARVLRPASPTAMADDPPRVFRAARFAAELPDFSPHPDLIAQMRGCAERGLLFQCVPERVGRETLAALAAPAPGRFLEVLDQTGCLAPWFSPLDTARAIAAGPASHHDRDLLGHTVQVVNRLAGDPLRAWMGLAHDLGKAATARELLPKHHGHELRGEGLARELGLRLRLPARYVKAGSLAARLHMNAGRYLALRPGSRVDLLGAVHAAGLFQEIFALVAADRRAGGGEDHGQAILAAAEGDLEKFLAVHLPAEEQNQGEASGARLRELRCLALTKEDVKRAGKLSPPPPF